MAKDEATDAISGNQITGLCNAEIVGDLQYGAEVQTQHMLLKNSAKARRHALINVRSRMSAHGRKENLV
jgi:hypothetical protein